MKNTGSLQVFEGDPLPLDWFMLATVVYGLSGAGKSVFARRVLEQVFTAGHRFCLVDPKGDSWGLKAHGASESEGLPVVIFGGAHGDLPLRIADAVAIGDAVAKLPQSTVLDLSAMPSLERPAFLGRFFETLFEKNSDPLFLACDEAQGYAPQTERGAKLRGKSDDRERCLAALLQIAEQGRQRALGRFFVTQRAPGLHTGIRELAECMVAFRTTGANELGRMKDWLGTHLAGAELTAALGSLPALDDGEALFVSSHKLVRQCARRRVLMPWTYDSSFTPKMGEPRRAPTRLSAPDLAALREALGTAASRAQADTLDGLRDRVTELEGEIGRERAARVEVPMFDAELFDALKRDVAEQIGRANQAVALARGNVEGALHVYMSKLLAANGARGGLGGTPRPAAAKGAFLAAPAAQPSLLPARAPRAVAVPQATGNGALKAGQLVVLTAIAQYPGGVTRPQLLTLTGRAKSTINRLLQELDALGYTREAGEAFTPTRDGMEALGADFQPLPQRGKALLEYWRSHLGQGQREVLDVLAEAYPDAVSREAISKATGHAKSTRNRLIYELVARRVCEKAGDGIRMAPELSARRQASRDAAQ